MSNIISHDNMDSLIPVIAIGPPAVAFLLFAAVLFLKYKKKKDKATMYFMLSFLCIGVGYGGWVVRSAFYPPDADAETVFFWFKFAYTVTAPFCTFLALAALEFLKPGVIRKTRNLFLFWIPMIFLEVWTLFSVPTTATIAGQNDAIWSPALSLGYVAIGGFYLIIINYVFVWFLMKEKGHRLYTKVMLMEAGLILLTLGTIIESSKIGVGTVESWGLFIRWFTALGALIMLYGYIKR